MKKLLLILFICISYSYVFAIEESLSWGGVWGDKGDFVTEKSLLLKIPFHSEYFVDFLLIHNENPDRPIDYQIINDSGDVLIKGSVSKENSAQITISVSDLPDNGIYTVILTSPDPNDWVYSKFKK